MKKLLLSLMCLCSLGAHADEGMWTLYNLPTPIFEQMKQYGFQLPMDQLYQSDNAVKNAVINFGGYCSGVVVSPDGLVFTNHHCGFECIRSHSTVEHDYMLNGFIAKSYAEELPNEDLFVSFMVEQKDVTDSLNSLGLSSLPVEKVNDFVDSVENAWSKSIRQQDSTLRVEVKPFYEGNKYYLTTYRDFEDVRLVFSVPKSMGKFGGETDNWMWPRQTCDYSVFRIYADPKTNGPAKYSKDNVPYHPKSWAKVSMDGYKPGDFAMIMGYPGSTSRYLSSYGIKERHDAINAPRVQVRGVKQEIMLRHMRADEAVRIKYDSKYANSSNYWKNSIGMNKCIDSIGLIQQKQEFEMRLRQWQEETGYLKGQLDFDKMAELYQKRLALTRVRTLFTETFLAQDQLSARAWKSNWGMKVEGPEDQPKKQYIQFDDNSEEWDEATDKEMLAALLMNYRTQMTNADYLPAFYQTIDKKFHGDYTAYVNALYKKSQLMKNGKPIYVNKKSYHKDMGVQYGLDLTELLAKIGADRKQLSIDIAEQEKWLCAAKLRMEQDLPNYSDANFTMRMTYGQIGEYTLGGRPSGYYTTARSLWEKMQKADDNFEYFAEPVMHELLSAKDYGKYSDPLTGTLQLCFLSNNDITGGNSGSPIFNGKGELLGLAFDGNWDSLASDIFFDRQLARTINVDVRFMLYMMDRWGHADRLLKEIGVQ
ncbi:MAG: S46 family peptidase [Prevotella sp.]|nr:S46 family peptidase [Prevotella sp.]